MSNTNRLSYLRKLAEEELLNIGKKLDNSKVTETKRLLHELDVYQVELDIQNQELLRTQEELNDSKELFFQLYNQAPVGYIVLDHLGIILQANDTISKMVDESLGVLEGKSITDCIHPSDKKIFLSRFRSFFKSPERKNIDLRWIGPSHKQCWVKICGRNIKCSLFNKDKVNQELLLLTISDITKTKQFENELESAKQIAEQASNAKSEFLAKMSHEIRTPMNGILGMTELLTLSKLNNRQKQQIKDISISGHTLLRVINDILDFSKIEANSFVMEKSSFNLTETLNSVMGLLHNQVNDKNLQLSLKKDFDKSLNIIGDSVRLSQVLLNLINNAIKFTEKGSVIVSVSMFNKSDKDVNLHFSVKDTGIGIPEEYQNKIFTAFTQADVSISRKYGGTGLGLAISQQLVEMMGGKLSFKSKKNIGSTFYFDLNFPINSMLKVENRSSCKLVYNDDKSNINILVVEDNEISQKVAIQYLELSGYTCIDVAENGLQALKRFVQNKYDIVLMDCEMPVLDGYKAAEAIRERELLDEANHIPIIALTAHAFNNHHEKITLSGMNDFLVKPYTLNNLQKKLSKWLNHDFSDVSSVIEINENASDISDLSPVNGEELIDNMILQQLEEAHQSKRPNYISTMANIYISQLSESIVTIEKSIEANNYNEIRTISHKLKSSSRTLGIEKLGTLYSQLEENFNNEKLIPEIFNELRKVGPKVHEKLDHYINNSH